MPLGTMICAQATVSSAARLGAAQGLAACDTGSQGIDGRQGVDTQGQDAAIGWLGGGHAARCPPAGMQRSCARGVA
jgi:hypothetical protein